MAPDKPPARNTDKVVFSQSDRITTKVVVVGDGAVGKTKTIENIKIGSITGEYKTTRGVAIQTLNHPFKVFTDDVYVGFWDFGGQERFINITQTNLKGSNAALLIFDLTKEETFKHLEYWENLLMDKARLDTTKIMYVGNKFDLEKDRQVSDPQFMDYVKNKKALMAFYTSAKTGLNVSPAFDALAHYSLLNYKLKKGEKVPEKLFMNKIKAIYGTIQGSKYTSIL